MSDRDAFRANRDDERRCDVCSGLVGDEGETKGECSWVQPAACESCGGCLCDGSC